MPSEAGAAKIVTAGVLVIGNEILSGRTQDANINYLAKGLVALGIRLMEVRVIPDDAATIIATLDAMRTQFDYVFTTGGIGPTHDDITAESIAKAFGVPLVLDPRAVALLTRHYGTSDLNDARLRMARIPEGASLVDNPVSAAPGFRIGNVFVLAGVPSICRAMFDGLKADLQGGDLVHSRTVSVFIGEGKIAKELGDLQARYPMLEIGSYPFFRQGKFGTSLVLRGTDPQLLGAAVDELRRIIYGLGANPIDGEALS